MANDAEADWITRLALPFRFDEAAARHIFSPVSNAAQNVAWENLKDYSFVTEADDAGWRTLHPRMRDALRKRLADPAKPGDAQNSHKEWSIYWYGRAQGEINVFAHLAWYHLYQTNPDEAFENWKEMASQARSGPNPQMAVHNLLLTWWIPTGIEKIQIVDDFRAAILNTLASELSKASLGSRTANLERAVSCSQRALHYYTEFDHPVPWAMTQNNLGNLYCNLPLGMRADNLNKAITCYEACLRVLNETTNPEEWTMAQHNLAIAYCQLPTGDRIQNNNEGINRFRNVLRLRKEDSLPEDWASTQTNLGTAYVTVANLTTDDTECNEHLLEAIICFQAALRVRTEEHDPEGWATTQNNMGEAYRLLRRGSRLADIRQAKLCLQNALRVRTESEFPFAWAGTMTNLGNVYAMLSVVDGPISYKQAIDCYDASLRVRTEAEYPAEWATTQKNRGIAYEFIGNIEFAIEAWSAAIRAYRSIGLEVEAEEIEGWLLRSPQPQ